jgi:hypothetical protein
VVEVTWTVFSVPSTGTHWIRDTLNERGIKFSHSHPGYNGRDADVPLTTERYRAERAERIIAPLRWPAAAAATWNKQGTAWPAKYQLLRARCWASLIELDAEFDIKYIAVDLAGVRELQARKVFGEGPFNWTPKNMSGKPEDTQPHPEVMEYLAGLPGLNGLLRRGGYAGPLVWAPG